MNEWKAICKVSDIREALMFGQSAIDNAIDSSVDSNGSNPAAAA